MQVTNSTEASSTLLPKVAATSSAAGGQDFSQVLSGKLETTATQDAPGGTIDTATVRQDLMSPTSAMAAALEEPTTSPAAPEDTGGAESTHEPVEEGCVHEGCVHEEAESSHYSEEEMEFTGTEMEAMMEMLGQILVMLAALVYGEDSEEYQSILAQYGAVEEEAAVTEELAATEETAIAETTDTTTAAELSEEEKAELMASLTAILMSMGWKPPEETADDATEATTEEAVTEQSAAASQQVEETTPSYEEVVMNLQNFNQNSSYGTYSSGSSTRFPTSFMS